jgi:hypothetical protein
MDKKAPEQSGALGRLTGFPPRCHASDELAYGAFRLLAAFLGLLAEPGSMVGHADQIGDATIISASG